MKKFNSLKKLLGAFVLIYILFCLTIYGLQKKILFPSHAAAPVALDWQPKGEQSKQALINGQCGKLHVALWHTPHAKGTLMMFHGNGESLASINNYVFAFHQLGYNLMSWDYPGYGQSTDCWFSQEMLLEDAETAYQWLAKQESRKNIHIFGYSLGTGIALSVAAKHQQNPVYLVAAYDALSTVAHNRFSEFLPINLLFRYPMQTAQWVEKIQQPIFLIHGSNDQVIQPASAHNLVKNAKGKAKIEWVANASHASDSLFEYRNAWLKQLLP